MTISLIYKSARLRPVSVRSDIKTLAIRAFSYIARSESKLLNGRPGEGASLRIDRRGVPGARSCLLPSCTILTHFILTKTTRDKEVCMERLVKLSDWEQLKKLPFSDFLKWAMTKLRTGQVTLDQYNALIAKYVRERNEWCEEMIRYAKEIEM